MAALVAMAAASEAEAGCRHYRFSEDVTGDGRWYAHEEWADEAALDAHFASAHMAEFRAAIPRFAAGTPTVLRFDVTGSRNLAD